MLRQQADHKDGRPNRSLADYVSPEDDRFGAFAVAIHGGDELSGRFEADNDPYRSIMVKALADRLAEAFASCCTSARGATGTRPAHASRPTT